MISAVQTANSPRPTYILLVFGVFCFCLVSVIRWFVCGPSKPDPWDEQIASDLRDGNCTPICHHCFNPHDPLINFCPECGAPVGKYTNLLPFLYPFSMGHTFRLGTSGRFRVSPLTVIWLMLAAWSISGLIALIYWVRLFLAIFNRPPIDTSADKVPDSGSAEL